MIETQINKVEKLRFAVLICCNETEIETAGAIVRWLCEKSRRLCDHAAFTSLMNLPWISQMGLIR